MKHLKIPTYWTPSEADGVCAFVQSVIDAIWESYGDDIELMHRQLQQQQETSETIEEFNDEIPF